MTTFDTGNPLGSPDPRDLFDNAQNTDDAVNGEGKTWVDRFGRTRVSMKGVEEAVPDAIAARDESESARDASVLARDAAIGAAGPLYATEAEGRAAVADGATFKVLGAGNISASVFRRVNSATSTLLTTFPAGSIDALSVNSGKSFPLRSAIRDGATSAVSTVANDALLDIQLSGARAGKIYRIEWMGNGTTALGASNAYAIYVSEYDEATYATGSAASKVDILATNDYDFSASPGTGVITRRIESKRIPGIAISVTYDTTKITGDRLSLNNSTLAGYSWIIDKACYPASLPLARSADVNRGKLFPFLNIARDGTTSANLQNVMNAVIDIKVVGARPGKLYRLEWYGNGTTAFGAPRYDMLFAEYDKANYGTSSATGRVDAVTLTDNPTLTAPSGIVTIRVDSPRINGLSFFVTYDASLLTTGTPIALNNSAGAGYSWVIDESCYIGNAQGTASPPVEFNYSAAGVLTVSFASTTECYRFTFGPNGANSLPNFIAISRAPGTDLASAVWTQLNTAGTDWLPPLILDSVVAGAPAERSEFTGGNHLVDGLQTATNRIYLVFADDKPVNKGSSGSCNKLRIVVVNDLMAGNTVSLGRYAARQAFNLAVTAGHVAVDSDVRALERVKFKRDYGLQCVTGGFQGTQLVLGGSNTAREPFDSTKTSGAKSAYPNAWAVVLQSSNGQLGMWLDKGYAAGSGALVDDAEALIRGGGASNTKWYLGVVFKMESTPEYAAGEGYRYRGGYSFGSAITLPAGFDSVMPTQRASHTTQTYALADGSSVSI
ncbi:hypothetical protein P245_15175 [Comamonas thiooxydans]|uniref:Uncharacterized protein n=1 Tax=Comamonas thiooxydans TaxID=363952 RepID=A0A0E3BD41_9BURK|nr:hypothetical protein [Comamonas thiooxydans]KGG90822.1 hypothetical protein P245_15175 [Comamonas thiooxydans]